jgi:hypothetical protein
VATGVFDRQTQLKMGLNELEETKMSPPAATAPKETR